MNYALLGAPPSSGALAVPLVPVAKQQVAAIGQHEHASGLVHIRCPEVDEVGVSRNPPSQPKIPTARNFKPDVGCVGDARLKYHRMIGHVALNEVPVGLHHKVEEVILRREPISRTETKPEAGRQSVAKRNSLDPSRADRVTHGIDRRDGVGNGGQHREAGERVAGHEHVPARISTDMDTGGRGH